MKIIIKIAGELLTSIRADLRRRHAFAHERVGFLKAGASLADGTLLLFAIAYQPVADEDYERDPLVGARIGGSAMRLPFAGFAHGVRPNGQKSNSSNTHGRVTIMGLLINDRAKKKRVRA